MTRFTLKLTICLLPVFSIAQSSSFSDSWILFDQVSISGRLYSNALPRMTTLSIGDDHVYFQNRDINTKGVDTTLMDTCFFDRMYSSQYRPDRYKEVVSEWSIDRKIFEMTTVIYATADKSKLLFRIKDRYSLEGQKMVLRRQFENMINRESWECRGVFETRDEE